MVRVVLKQPPRKASSFAIASVLIVSCLSIMFMALLYVNFGLSEVPVKVTPVHVPPVRIPVIVVNEEPSQVQQGQVQIKQTAPAVVLKSNINTALISSSSNADCCSEAQRESNSFFTDISNANWKLMKEIYKSMQPNNSLKNLSKQKRKADPTDFWNNNYEPEFTCAMQRRLGIAVGDGGKWVCDPHRIASSETKPGCLVYSIGSNGNAMFEKAMHAELTPRCDGNLQIHTFDLKGWNKRNGSFKDRVSEAGGVFHEWGMTVDDMDFEQDEYFIPKVYRTLQFKTFTNTFEELGHKNRVIDVLKIDCEGCEWQSVQGWLRDWKANGVVVQQLLLELHDAPLPQAPNFFQILKDAGYVIFHKEVTGSCAEYAFILVDTTFFQ